MPRKTSRKSKTKMGRRGRGNVTRKTMKRSKGRKKSSRKAKSRSKVKKVSQILSSSYGLAGMYKENQKGYKGQRVAKKDPYKKQKQKPPPIPSNIKGKKKKKKASKTLSLSSQSGKNSFLAGIQSNSKSKGSWIDHVKKVYEQGKSVPGYKYKDAMKDAKKTW
jgi:hypothetical protein